MDREEKQKIAESLHLDLEKYQMLLDIFFKQTDTQLGDIEAALQENDAKKVKEILHSIKGSSGSLQIQDTFKTSKELNDHIDEHQDVEYIKQNIGKLIEAIASDRSGCIE